MVGSWSYVNQELLSLLLGGTKYNHTELVECGLGRLGVPLPTSIERLVPALGNHPSAAL